MANKFVDGLELYYNWGKGFHLNDARGVVNAVDPVPGISDGVDHEVGIRLNIGDFKFTATEWDLDQDSQLMFVGDSHSVEPKGASERQCSEVTLFWQPVEWLGLDAANANRGDALTTINFRTAYQSGKH